MIFHDTPYEEIIRVMESESEKVRFVQKKIRGRTEKAIKSHCRIPHGEYVSYTVPSSANTYLIWDYLAERRDVHKILIKSGAALMLNNDIGSRELYVIKDYVQDGPEGQRDIRSLHVFTGHFFGRYRERSWPSSRMETMDLLVTFLGRNMAYMFELDHRQLNRRSGYKDACVWQMADGFSFGNRKTVNLSSGKSIEVVRHNTFINESMLYDRQARHTMPEEIVNYILKNI